MYRHAELDEAFERLGLPQTSQGTKSERVSQSFAAPLRRRLTTSSIPEKLCGSMRRAFTHRTCSGQPGQASSHKRACTLQRCGHGKLYTFFLRKHGAQRSVRRRSFPVTAGNCPRRSLQRLATKHGRHAGGRRTRSRPIGDKSQSADISSEPHPNGRTVAVHGDVIITAAGPDIAVHELVLPRPLR